MMRLLRITLIAHGYRTDEFKLIDGIVFLKKGEIFYATEKTCGDCIDKGGRYEEIAIKALQKIFY